MSIFQTYVHKDSLVKVAKNFREHEFFCKCPDFPGNYHLLDPRLIAAAQCVRNFARCPVYITSTFRTPACNYKMGGAHDSLHLKGLAIDLNVHTGFPSVVESIKEFSELFLKLYSVGIKGFGFYPSHLHLDLRTKGSLIHKGRSYTFWNN